MAAARCSLPECRFEESRETKDPGHHQAAPQGLPAPKCCLSRVKSFALTCPLASKSAQGASQVQAQKTACPKLAFKMPKSAGATRSLWSASPTGRVPKFQVVGWPRVKVTCRATVETY